MELSHLRYFIAVAEQLNFSRAAERVNVSQSALSQQIRNLELELGIALFRRTKRRVELTDAGSILLEGTRQALVQIEESVRMAREAGGAEPSRLKVGFPEYANYTPIADILQTFQQQHPNIRLEQHEVLTLQETLGHARELREGMLDVGFLLLPIEDDKLEIEPALRIELVAALPEGHPLSAWPELPLRTLARERLILFSRHFHPGCYDYIVECCRESGFSPILVRTDEPQLYSGATTYRMVATGVGIGIVARPRVSAYRPAGVVFRALREPTPTLDLVAAWRRNNASPNLRAFLEIVRKHIPAEVRRSEPRTSALS